MGFLTLIRRVVITTAYALSGLGLCLLALDLAIPTGHQETPIAWCPMVDSIRIHSTHWNQERRPVEPLRTIAAPKPEECQ